MPFVVIAVQLKAFRNELQLCEAFVRHFCFIWLLQILVLRNHGIVICGSSVEEAFHLAFNTMSAVDVQVESPNH
jgi:ribulose-5-phosphate 4-epimerase/fuculose-1-phosphate aldolase